MISAEQFAEWKTHPVTKEIFEEIKAVKEKIENKLNSGVTIGRNAEDTHGLTSRAVGHIEGLEQLLNISYADENFVEEVNAQSGY